MVEIVAEEEGGAGDGGVRGKGEGDGVLVVEVGGVAEVGGCGGGVGGEAVVVLDADGDGGGAEGGGDAGWGGGVYVDEVVGGGVVAGAGGYAEDVFVCHCGGWEEPAEAPFMWVSFWSKLGYQGHWANQYEEPGWDGKNVLT